MPADIEFYLLDMDGTIYLGRRLIEGARDFIELLGEQGKGYCFLTNNSSRGARSYLDKLRNFGIAVDRENLVTSTDLLIHYLHKAGPGAALYPVGTRDFEGELAEAGFRLVHEYRDPPFIDYVVLGFDTTLNYQKLFDATRYIRQGVPYIATHPDLNCPLEEGVYMPDCGAIIAFIKASTDISPLKVLGKPNPLVIDYLVETRGLERAKTAIVGDRLYTDILLGKSGRITSILVLSGESTREDVAAGTIEPDLTFDSIKELYDELRRPGNACANRGRLPAKSKRE